MTARLPQRVADLVKEAQKRSIASPEDAALFFRGQGLSKVESIAAVASLLGLNLDDAKRLVHTSEAWKDRRLSDEKFHDALEKVVRGEDDEST